MTTTAGLAGRSSTTDTLEDPTLRGDNRRVWSRSRTGTRIGIPSDRTLVPAPPRVPRPVHRDRVAVRGGGGRRHPELRQPGARHRRDRRAGGGPRGALSAPAGGAAPAGLGPARDGEDRWRDH